MALSAVNKNFVIRTLGYDPFISPEDLQNKKCEERHKRLQENFICSECGGKQKDNNNDRSIHQEENILNFTQEEFEELIDRFFDNTAIRGRRKFGYANSDDITDPVLRYQMKKHWNFEPIVRRDLICFYIDELFDTIQGFINGLDPSQKFIIHMEYCDKEMHGNGLYGIIKKRPNGK